MTIDILGEAAALIQAGKKTEARKLLEPFIEANLQNIPAWLLEVETQSTVAEKKRVLEVCLRYNPNALQVQQALAKLETTASRMPSLMVPKLPPAQGAIPKPSASPRGEAQSGTNRNRIILGCRSVCRGLPAGVGLFIKTKLYRSARRWTMFTHSFYRE